MMPMSERYVVRVDGQEVAVFHTAAGDYAVVCFEGQRQFAIDVREPFDAVTVRPLGGQYGVMTEGQTIRLTLTDWARVSVEPFGLRHPLFLLCARPIPTPQGVTHHYHRGMVSHIGEVVLHSHDTVYIEEGAVVVGSFHAEGADHVTITGNGMLWESPLHGGSQRRQVPLLFVDCEDVRVSGITVVDSPTWNLVPVACRRVAIDGVNIIGIVMSSDGIDVVGCEDVTIAHCFLCVNDDCIAVKANDYDDPRGRRDVRRVHASDCVLWSQKCGNVLEIGYETSCEEICGVVFEDMDVIHAQFEGWQSGGVFTIHNGDRAHVHDIVYRNIRVEDAEEKLIDVKILSSKYSMDATRGRVSDLAFEDIRVSGSQLPPSILRGYESDAGEPNLIAGVRIRNLTWNGEKITSQLQAHLIAELCREISFA